MNIPPFFNYQWVDKEGRLTPETQIYEDRLNQVFQDGLSDNGWTLPQQTTSNINDIAASMPNGTIWYDVDTDEIKAKVGGVVVVVYP